MATFPHGTDTIPKNSRHVYEAGRTRQRVPRGPCAHESLQGFQWEASRPPSTERGPLRSDSLIEAIRLFEKARFHGWLCGRGDILFARQIRGCFLYSAML